MNTNAFILNLFSGSLLWNNFVPENIGFRNFRTNAKVEKLLSGEGICIMGDTEIQVRGYRALRCVISSFMYFEVLIFQPPITTLLFSSKIDVKFTASIC